MRQTDLKSLIDFIKIYYQNTWFTWLEERKICLESETFINNLLFINVFYLIF
jgi:hypothetical protein